MKRYVNIWTEILKVNKIKNKFDKEINKVYNSEKMLEIHET